MYMYMYMCVYTYICIYIYILYIRNGERWLRETEVSCEKASLVNWCGNDAVKSDDGG
jgi:hypothetical protein